MIESKEISLSSGKMLSILFMQYGKPWLIITLGGIILFCLLGGLVDLRFFVLALIWVFLFIPLIVAFLYFFYGMKPLTAFNSIPHKIIVDDNTLDVEIPQAPTEESEEASIPTNGYKNFKVNNEEFISIKTGPDYMILLSKKDGLLWIPVSGFEDISQFQTLYNKYVSR